MENLTHCPLCGKNSFKEFLKAKDHFLSGQEFSITACTGCGFKFTNPRPDKSEIVSYYESPDYIAHDSGKGTLFESAYNLVRKYMIDKKLKLVFSQSKGKELLDIGCGTGEFLHYCQHNGYTITGIEPNEKARNFAKGKYNLNVLDEPQIDLFPPGSFDVITMWHVLEHVHDLNPRIRRIHQLLKPGGTFIIAVPNCDSWDAEYYNEYWAAYDLPRHLYHFTKETMKFLVEKSGFTLSGIYPLKFDSFYVSLLSQKYKTGKKNFFTGFKNGVRSNRAGARKDINYSSLIYICKMAGN